MKSPCFLLLALLVTPWVHAQNSLPLPTSEAAARPFAELSSAVPSHTSQVTTASASSGGLDITVTAGPAGFPGVNFAPAAPYDLTGTGYIEAHVTNTSSVIINVVLRADSGTYNAAGNAYLKPGESGKARVYFATPGKGSNALNASAITKLLLFIGKNEKVDRTIRLDALVAGGRPGEQAPTNPDLVRTKPANGLLFGGNLSFDAAKQLLPRGGAKADSAGANQPVEVSFTGQPAQTVLLRPARGFWDLGDYLQVKIRVKNTGSTPAALTAQLTSRGDVSDFGLLDKPLAPGAVADLVVPFIPRTPFEILSDPAQSVLEGKKNWGVKETPGARYHSHQTTGIVFAPADATKPSSFQIIAIGAGLPPPPPAWLGQRPPVEGEWVKTFEDNFDGTAYDETKWNPYSGNFWDQRVGFSKQNIILKGDGLGRLRIEKRDGFHNDDPSAKATTFATGWLDTYGKWTQRYGYYEVRVKLPTAPSMFPAFWLMPERGPKEWPKYKRTDTKDGGMEFDIFEGQSMWGPYRTTFGMHFDSYVKYHKTAGTSVHYNQPDKDGFLTIGMLWTPGHVSVYSQGRKGGSWDSARVGSVQSYLIFDMLPGGFEYDPLDPAKLPAELVIDYVRVWQRKDLATPEDGPKIP